MSVTVKLKHSSVQDKAPQPTDLTEGELALNINSNSPAAYIKDSAGNIVKLAGVGGVSTPDASETVKGIAELATQAEVTAGTDDERIVTPLKLKTELDKRVDEAPDGTADGTVQYARQVVTAGTGGTPTNTKTWAKVENFWKRTGTAISPKTAGDTVQISAGTDVLPGLTPVGDPDTGVFSAGADQVAISTGGTGRLFVDASGQVSISSQNSATVPLRLYSSSHAGDAIQCVGRNTNGKNQLQFYSADGVTGQFQLSSSDNGVAFKSQLDADITILTNNVERVRVHRSGPLLVGTSSLAPGSAAKLQCHTTANLNDVAVYADNTAALAGGLVKGDIYRKTDGTLMITF